MTEMQYYFLAAIIVFTVINIFIGFLSRKGSVVTASVYVANPNNTGMIPLVLSLSGTIVGGGMFFAVAQLGFEAGFAGIYLGISYFVGFFILGSYSKKIRNELSKYSVLTIFDYLDRRYGNNGKIVAPGAIYRAAISILYFMFLAGQLLILSGFIENVFPSVSTYSLYLGSVIVFVLNSVTYTFLGGLKKDILTDVWQMVLVFIGVFLLVTLMGGSERILELDKELLLGTSKGIVLLIGILFFTGPSLILRPDMWQRIITAKCDKTAKNAFYFAGVLSFLFFSFFTIIGMYSRTIGLESGELFFYKIFQDQNNVIAILVLLALLGAIMSSADTFLNVCSISIAGLYKRASSADSTTSLVNIRIATVFVSVVTIAVASYYKNIIDIFVTGFGVLFIFFPMVLHALFSEKINFSAARISSSVGFIIYLVLIWFIPREAFLPGFLVSIILFLIIKRRYNKSVQ
jgi:SSS family solute:Na+ symporter